MKSHRQYVKEQVEGDPQFAKDLASARAEVKFSVELAAIREKRGLSQRALAALTGIKQPQIARLEGGDYLPRMGTLIRVLTALGATANLGPNGCTIIADLTAASPRISIQKTASAKAHRGA